jgi:hypothetical protein
VALRARLLALFCKSVAAANCFPHSLTVSCLRAAAGWMAILPHVPLQSFAQ